MAIANEFSRKTVLCHAYLTRIVGGMDVFLGIFNIVMRQAGAMAGPLYFGISSFALSSNTWTMICFVVDIFQIFLGFFLIRTTFLDIRLNGIKIINCCDLWRKFSIGLICVAALNILGLCVSSFSPDTNIWAIFLIFWQIGQLIFRILQNFVVSQYISRMDTMLLAWNDVLAEGEGGFEDTRRNARQDASTQPDHGGFLSNSAPLPRQPANIPGVQLDETFLSELTAVPNPLIIPRNVWVPSAARRQSGAEILCPPSYEAPPTYHEATSTNHLNTGFRMINFFTKL